MAGKIDDDSYETMFDRYQNERKALKTEVAELERQLKALDEEQDTGKRSKTNRVNIL